jgi:hypothetical protein
MSAPAKNQIADGEILVEVTGQPDADGCVPFTSYRLSSGTGWTVRSKQHVAHLERWIARNTHGGQKVRRWTGGAR